MTTVGDVVSRFADAWGSGAQWRDVSEADRGPHEAGLLALDVSKAAAELGWAPRVDLSSCLSWTAAWYRSFYSGASQAELRELTLAQVDDYMSR
jgi:CDP-glucose 4,6-dehydratase